MGNSPTALWNAIPELHIEEWLHKQLQYLDDCRRFRFVECDESNGSYIAPAIVIVR